MPKVEPLPTSRLHAKMDPAKIPYEDSTQISLARTNLANSKLHFQPRAWQALDLALKIKTSGYNVYVSGYPGLGRTHTVLTYLEPWAKKAKAPDDLIYVYNFQKPDCPRLIHLPKGCGVKVKTLFTDAIQGLTKKIISRFDNPNYIKKHAEISDKFQNRKMELLNKMNEVAHAKGFHIEIDDSGALGLCPMADGKRLTDSELEKLDSAVRLDLKRQGDNLVHDMAGMMRDLAKVEEAFQEDERNLEREVVAEVLEAQLTPCMQKILRLAQSQELQEYFRDVHTDIVKNGELFLQKDQPQNADGQRFAPSEELLTHYEINLFVDHTETIGAPIVFEEHPTAANLLGCVEREAELGTLVTNFSLIKSGSLHRANGGFLVVRVNDLVQYPYAWEGLLRALRANELRIEDIDEVSDSTIRTKGIMPEALKLDLKVILIGDEDSYEALLESDERFAKLFRLKAHLSDVAERNAANIKRYLVEIAKIIHQEELLPFKRDALAWLVDHGCHLSEDQRRLSLRFPQLRELMLEACAFAQSDSKDYVSAEILEKAYGARIYRANLVEEEFLEEYDREMIKVQTQGTAIGQVNGLSVTTYGDFEFGLPHRIACTVGVGQEGIIDLEREAELGGPIHTKATMILKSFLINHFAQKKPLVLSGSLYFEQNYAGIEGDSASGAELVALLSALGQVPVRLDLAFTGAVSHTGQILPVGGVTRKIEGFFKVCAYHGGLTGTQGVLIPHDNIDHLMLAPEVLAAVEAKQFAIYPVKTIEEALFLLTGLAAGRQLKDGGYTAGSLYDLVDRRLQLLGEYAENAFKKTSRKKN